MKKPEFCLHCGTDYIPARRGAQKFCSNSCRSRNWFLKQHRTNGSKLDRKEHDHGLTEIDQEKKEKMSLAGVGNAAAGVVAVNILTSILTKDENKPATRKEVRELKSLILGGRYFPVINGQNDLYGRGQYYDIETGYLVYLNH